MTDREMLDHFSDVLISDPRLLSLQERELLSNLLQRTLHINGDNGIAETIARAVGETVAGRMHEALGTSILQRLAARLAARLASTPNRAGFTPRPPSPSPPGQPPGASVDLMEKRTQSFTPRPPSPSPPGQPPGTSVDLTEKPTQSFTPRPPSPSPPGQPPGASVDLMEKRTQSFTPRPPSPSPPGQPPGTSLATAARSATDSSNVSLMEPAEILPAQCVILEEFLPPLELESLIQDTLRRESEFHVSEVISPGVNGGMADFEHRRSRVLLDIGTHGAALAASVKACLPRILPRLGHETFAVSHLEAQITASNDGDFFRWHNDNSHEEVALREITFVYFFHREPKKFRGGELRIYDSRWQDGYVPTENYRNIVPRQNQLVAFPSCLAHEITLVDCPSRAFADSRFTVNGWFHR